MNRTLQLLLLAAFLLGFAHDASATQVTELGKELGRFQVPQDWKPGNYEPSSGPHQWMRTEGSDAFFMVAVEMKGLFVEDSDFVDSLTLACERIAVNFADPVSVSEVEFERLGSYGVAKAGVSGTKGLALHLEFRLIGHHGLAYLIFISAEEDQAARSSAFADEAASLIRMPDRKSGWFSGLVPKRHTIGIKGFRISMSVPPSLLQKREPRYNTVMEFASADERFFAYVIKQRNMTAAEPALDRIEGDLAINLDSLEPLRRTSERIGGREARMAAYVGTFGETQQFLESYATPAWDNHVVELRFISYGPEGAHEALRTMIRNSFKLEDLGLSGAFPPPLEAVPEVPTLDPELQALFAISTEHGELPSYDVTRGSSIVGDRLLLSTPNAAHLVDSSAKTPTELFVSKYGGYDRSTAQVGQRLLTVRGGQLFEVENGIPKSLDVPADFVIALEGKRSLLLRQAVADETFGFLYDPPSRSQLVERSESGSEEVIYSPVDVRLQQVSMQGNHLLVAQYTPSSMTGNQDLVVLDRRDLDQATPAGAWRSVRHIHGLQEGWLVVGRPVEGALGTYLVLPSGTRERILDGVRVMVVGMTPDERLFYLRNRNDGSWSGSKRGSALYSVDLAKLQATATLRSPWSPHDFTLLGREALRAKGISASDLIEAADWTSFLDVAERLSQQRFGCGFPHHVDAADELLNQNVEDLELGDDGRLLLTALAVRALMESGAEWVADAADERAGIRVESFTYSNELCCGMDVANAVAQISDSETGAMFVIRNTLNEAGDSDLIIGTNFAAIRMAVDAAREPLTRVQVGPDSLGEFRALLDASPDNLRLRRSVYKRLIGGEQPELALALASHFSAGSDACDTDIALFLGMTEPTKANADERVKKLRDAIARSPRTPDFYVLLGETYEKRSQSGDGERAVACFSKAAERLRSGFLYDRAKAGLERLGEE